MLTGLEPLLHRVKAAASVDELRAAYRRLMPIRLNGKASWLGPHFNKDLGHIMTPAGGAVKNFDIWNMARPIDPHALKAINVLGGLHEGFERGAVSRAGGTPPGFHMHAAPRVLLDENNMLAALHGPGATEARKSFQGMRSIENEGHQIEEAVRRLSGGRFPYTYGETKLPKALKARLDVLLQGMT